MLLSAPASGAESLADAIKQADAKYLDAPDVEPVDNAPKIEAGGGEETEQATPPTQEISQGAVKAILSYVEEKTDEGEVIRSPVVTVLADGKEVAKLEGDDSAGFANPPVSLQIAELDPGNQHPEVVVSFYTGGAHCCSVTSVVTSSADGNWRTVDVDEFDGGPLLAVDIDGDGRYEFETRDNAFLYTFGCYACSEAPLYILAIENGAVKNVSGEERFRPAHAAYLKSMMGNVPEEEPNGFLAGYVGEKILLGEGKQAWEIMLAHYDHDSDWGLETCEEKLNEDGECAAGTIKLTFPDALERMLKESGYKVEK